MTVCLHCIFIFYCKETTVLKVVVVIFNPYKCKKERHCVRVGSTDDDVGMMMMIMMSVMRQKIQSL